ncbi:MAG: hypothetical protein ACLGIJ_12805 [Candidatus Limnocylindria bacterium]
MPAASAMVPPTAGPGPVDAHLPGQGPDGTIVLDAIAAAAPGSAGAPSLGEDGLMGGLPFRTLSDP